MKPWKCRDVAAHASDAVEAALSPWERLQVRAHNLFCRNCRTYYAQIDETARTLRETPRPTISEHAKARLLERLKDR